MIDVNALLIGDWMESGNASCVVSVPELAADDG
ncbi:hypothetical protein EPYR_01819 [Erwinia pyrifoliae DSM 12163]|nr:hypothetical protein EPYR_01819 [Erwinia pyrifoliae DSM 12163]